MTNAEIRRQRSREAKQRQKTLKALHDWLFKARHDLRIAHLRASDLAGWRSDKIEGWRLLSCEVDDMADWITGCMGFLVYPEMESDRPSRKRKRTKPQDIFAQIMASDAALNNGGSSET